MDERLKNALDFSNYRMTLAVQRKSLKENMESKLSYGYNGGIFHIDMALISFVQMLIDKEKIADVPILDQNQNPILIDDVNKFRDEIFDRYFSVTYEYLNKYEALKKSRSVEKLVDL